MIDKFCQLWLSWIQRCILFRLLLLVIIDWQVMTIGSICSCWSMPVLVLNHPMVILFINDTWNEFLLWLHLSAFVLLFTEQPNTNDCIQLHSRLNMSIDISNTELNWTWLLNISSFVPIQEQRWLYRISLMTQSRVLFSDRLHIVKKKENTWVRSNQTYTCGTIWWTITWHTVFVWMCQQSSWSLSSFHEMNSC